MAPKPFPGLQEQALQRQIEDLRSRVRRLEEALHSHGIVLQKEEARPAGENAIASPEGTPVSASSSETAVVRPPRVDSAGAVRDKSDRSLESRIGSQWLNRIGILAVLIGMAWFLKLAVDNRWVGPLGRVLTGLAAGAGLIAWSERFRRRGYAGFAYSLKAVASGILYLSLWAAFSLFHIIPSSVAFAAMILVTAFNGFFSWMQDAELLAVYAIAGGLGTPLLISTGQNDEVILLSYLLLLDLAVLVLVALRPWPRLLFGAFAGTVLFFTWWWIDYYSNAQSVRTSAFLGCFFLIFALAPRAARTDAGKYAHLVGWNSLALILLPIVNGGLGFLAYYAILKSCGAEGDGAWLAIAFAAFYLLLSRLPAQGDSQGGSGGGLGVLPSLHLTAAVVFLTISIPLKAHGRWPTIGWLVEGAALFWVAVRGVQSRLLRVLALLCLALGLAALVAVSPPASTPFLNQRFGAFSVGIAVFSFVAWMAGKARVEEGRGFPLFWSRVASAAAVSVNALILLAIGWEIHSYWRHLRRDGDWSRMHDYRMYSQFTYSSFFMLFGAILLVTGFWRRSAFLRWQALVLLAVAIGKVFLVDVSELNEGYRIVSFLGLGALLLAVSFIYQRDWLNLRGGDRRT